MRKVFSGMVAVVFTATAVLYAASPASATYHGKNGRIAYFLDKGDGAEIYTMRKDGTDRVKLTDVDGRAVQPDWSPDGRKIVFEFDHPSGACSIELMRADGTHIRTLTKKGCEATPSFTPGGHRIVFASDQGIKRMGLHGKNRRLITPIPESGIAPGSGGEVRNVDVSPDGRWVIFGVIKDLGIIDGLEANAKALYIVRMNGNHVRKLVGFHLDVGGGDWAPNGKRIEFSDHSGYGAPLTKPVNLRTIRPDGTGLRFVTHFHDVRHYVANGSYSPNGRWILFRTDRGGAHFKLWKVHPDGSDTTLVGKFRSLPGGRDWGSRPQ